MINQLAISSFIMLILDAIFLSINKTYFITQITDIQNKDFNINYYGLILCYIILILGLNYFIINENKSIQDAFLLGVFTYGVYETTNLSTFTNWKLKTVFIDTLWGGILFALTTFFTYEIQKLNVVKNLM
jgi:hypothetical protein